MTKNSTTRVAAIDQGTTSTRVLVCGEGEPRVAHQVEHRQLYEAQGRVEHDPAELVRNIEACLEAAGKVDAIGIDNQGESCLAWNAETKEPVSNVIVWQDSRTQDVVERMKADGLEAETLARAGLPLDVYFSASKLAWILDNIPQARTLAGEGKLRLGTTDAFFLDRLTGRCVTDVTTASRTSLMNLDRCEWDPTLCELFGVPPETLPEIVPTTGDFGVIRGIPVTASVVDQQAALYGHGCRQAGDTKITFGTGAFVLAVTGEQPVRDNESGLLPTVAWQRNGEKPVYALDGGVSNAGSALAWLKSIGVIHSYDELSVFDNAPAIDRGVAFVPALSGLACPHWDRRAAGMWIGLTLDSTREDLAQAVLEGVALRTAEVVAAMTTVTPIRGTVSVDGGLTRSQYFLDFLADVLERGIDIPPWSELTALGTAGLAAEYVGETILSNSEWPTIQPRGNGTERLTRFSDAVQRARGWWSSP